MSKLTYDINDLFVGGLPQAIELPDLGETSFQNSFTNPISPGTIDSGDLPSVLEHQGVLFSGKTTFNNTQTGYRLGLDGSTAKFYIGNASSYINWDGSSLSVVGGLTVDKLNIPDEDTTANSFHVNTAGDAWWGATKTNFDANNDNAKAYILKTGVAKFQNVILQSGNILAKINSDEVILIGSATNPTTGTGIFLGKDGSDYEFRVGNPSNQRIHWDGSSLLVVGNQKISKIFTAAENITSGNAVRMTLSDNEVIDSTDNTNDYPINGVGSLTRYGLKYTVGASDQYVNQLKFMLKKTGSPGTLTVNLRSGSITGTIEASGTIAEGDIPTSNTEITLTLDKLIKLLASTDYYIEWVPTTADASNYVTLRAGATSGGPGTKAWTYTGSWSSAALPTFYLKVGISDGGGGKVRKAKATTQAEADLFRGVANETITSGNSGEVIINGIITTTGLVEGEEYYLSNTSGAISLSAGTITRKIGLSFSTTELLMTHIW